ncbi:MAG: hypothetical protein CFE21_09800 [Bacteroidetes bacterium B1(2017)]|nr:MAG: hypothetical protein CFE21_09800 [Bacteroidetes bacterium B1(2017)]
MKPILVFCLSIFLSLSISFAQKPQKGFHYFKNFHKNFVQVNETIYACKYETANIDYLIFLNAVKYRFNPAMYQGLLPDTAKWRGPGLNNEPYVNYYFRYPAYYNYPLVNISYEQANFYCTWLTQQYNSNPKREFKKVLFKIPSPTEWQQAAAAGNMENLFPWGSRIDKIPSGVVVNYCPKDYIEKIWVDSLYSNDGTRIKTLDSIEVHTECHPYKKPFYTQAVNYKKAKQNTLGLYHVAGNVSEMINEKGSCAGGNYRSKTDWLRIDAPNEFYPSYIPCPLVGFRVFMQVLEK